MTGAPPGRAAPPTVLYVAGAGRSGSTLLGQMLSQLPGVLNVGELTLIWERSFRENQLCGCRTTFRECAFWGEVVGRAFGGFDRVDHERAITLRRWLCAMTRVPALSYPSWRSRRTADQLAEYLALLGRLYRALVEVSGARVIVDSSKYPPEGFLLRSLPDIRLVIAHLVRDSNAVAYAWQKRMVRPDVHWTTAYMPRYPVVQTAIAWNVFNLLLEWLGARGVPYRRIRYEDLVAQPAQCITSLARWLELPAPDLSFISATEIQVPTNHTVSGNPSRFREGAVPLKLDDEWRTRAPAAQRALVTALTFPLQYRYGYR